MSSFFFSFFSFSLFFDGMRVEIETKFLVSTFFSFEFTFELKRWVGLILTAGSFWVFNILIRELV